MANENLDEIEVPDDKMPDEYHYTERRAELLRLIKKKGHFGGFNYSQLGRRYDVSHTQIRKDFKRIREFYEPIIGENSEVKSEVAFQKIIEESLDRGDLDAARRALTDYNEWLGEIGEQRRIERTQKHAIASASAGDVDDADAEELYMQIVRERDDGPADTDTGSDDTDDSTDGADEAMTPASEGDE